MGRIVGAASSEMCSSARSLLIYWDDSGIVLARKNALFAGHDAGAENWATIASLVEAYKLNAVDPLAYLTATLTAIVNGHKRSRIEELLSWKFLSQDR
ncbi:hypothetical protein M2311_003817 [Rhizobium leguminosarum]|nr:hypothetical protein [Rhizobium leguminosarum]